MSPENLAKEIKMDADNLYREETYTDRRTGAIRQLTPVDRNGREDASRATLYVGQAQLLTPMGALPLSFEIDAASLTEAIEKFPAAVKQAVEKTVAEAEKIRRDSASSIVIPEVGPGGNVPGGGNIKLP